MELNYKEQLEKLEETGSLRQFRPLARKGGCYVDYNGRTMLNMTSNDYLGIAGNRQILKDFYDQQRAENLLQSYGLGAASSRLLTGDISLSHMLEEQLCHEYGRSGCLLFNSGYHANIGILPALTHKKDLILSDKLNHASIHDGLRLSRATHKRFRHCDYDHLYSLLKKERGKYNRVVIATESVFSMDGDVADLHKLVELKKEFDCLLYVDEAHGVGVYGDHGLGKIEEFGLLADVDLIVGTFGKAFSSVGAFIVCSKDIREYLINYSRPLIFTTALPPVVTHWNLFIFQRIVEMSEERAKLVELGSLLRRKLAEEGLESAGTTNIVPVVIGDNPKTVDLAARMQDQGYLIFAVRPPTVPAGTARFRLSLTADMTWEDIADIPRYISEGMSAQ